MTKIVTHIRKNGGILSGDLSRIMSKKYGITEEAARKRIERFKSPIHKLKGIFSDKKSFIYHSDDYQTEEYYDGLLAAIMSDAKRIGAIITAIKFHHGLVNIKELANYSISPISRIDGHMKFDTLIELLLKNDFVRKYDDETLGLNAMLGGKPNPNLSHIKAIELSKAIVLQRFEIWSKNIGLTSFKKGKNNNVVGGFQFAFSAPTYIDGLTRYKGNVKNPGFLIADILLCNDTNEETVSFFLRKIAAIKASNPVLDLFPVIIVDGIKTKALNKLKSNGVLIASVKELFGNEYSELLKSLINTVTNAGAILKKDPEQYINLMEKLTKLVDGKTNNLRGDLFELAVGYYYSKYCRNLDISKRVTLQETNQSKEIDVLAVFENEVKIVECKGYNYPVDIDYIEHYISNKIVIIRKWALNVYPEKSLTFEIWSTGGFTEAAEKKLATAKVKTKKYDIEYFNKQKILEKANGINSPKFKEILRDYFLKEIA